MVRTGEQVTYKAGSQYLGAMRPGEVVEVGSREVRDGGVTVTIPVVTVRDTETGEEVLRPANQVRSRRG